MKRFVSIAVTMSMTALAAAPAKQLSHFPTDAECKALGSVMSPMPFGPGEQLSFDIDSMGMRAGEMKMTTLPTQDGVMTVETTVETNTFFSKIRKVKGVARSEVSPTTLRPSRYFEDAWENDFHRVADVSMNPKLHEATLVNTFNDKTTSPTKLRFGFTLR